MRRIMEFTFGIPTKIFFGRDCILKNAAALTAIGSKAMLVTGKHSAKASGALDDVVSVLDKAAIGYVIFDEIENNPSVETVAKAAKIARQEEVDFVIGIGGGSPIDASKAIAVLAANKEMIVTDLFKNDFTKALPIVGIPTTAGTGSEATPYSVLLRKDMQTKVSFGTKDTFPAVAFVDAKYTMSLGKNSTISTAVDAFTHAFEGYLANRSTVISDCFALEAIKAFGKSMRKLAAFELDESDRENLMLVSLLGGIIIAQTGVTIAHGMGYCYTYFKGIPHGAANGLIMREYMKLNYDVAKDKIDTALEALGCESIDEFAGILREMLGAPPVLTSEEIELYTELTQIQKGSMANTPHKIDEKAIKYLWEHID
ncbi:MAG: iron-containing alcohol dehydrogenase family protein [Bacteroides sp.]